MKHIIEVSTPYLWVALTLVASYLATAVLTAILFSIANRFVKKTKHVFQQSLVIRVRRPTQMAILLILFSLLIQMPPISLHLRETFNRFIGLPWIAVWTWLILAMIRVAEDVVIAKYQINVSDNLHARRIQTQIKILRHIGVVLLLVVSGSMVLMTFPGIRHLGVSLLASAGLVGLVVGMAARPALSNLIAGVQIAFTQPIRLDDVVVVEGEWGRIEEINTTNVIVRIWDLRRLVLPLTYFIETPFQNWTRTTANIMGTVFLYVDYTVPVEEVRKELGRIMEASELWDKGFWNLQVTDSKNHTVELRALMTAADSSIAWDLRCDVREKLIAFLQKTYPDCLPKTRIEIENSNI